jgi:hypothetical protein
MELFHDGVALAPRVCLRGFDRVLALTKNGPALSCAEPFVQQRSTPAANRDAPAVAPESLAHTDLVTAMPAPMTRTKILTLRSDLVDRNTTRRVVLGDSRRGHAEGGGRSQSENHGLHRDGLLEPGDIARRKDARTKIAALVRVT